MEKVMENIIESYNKVDLILKKLLLCTEKEEVDALFEENHITDYSVRSVLLNKCMGVISTFETPEKITEKERYELDKFAFVEGTKETVRLDNVIKNYKRRR